MSATGEAVAVPQVNERKSLVPAVGRSWLPRTGFGRLWFGETISQFGSQITFLAVPLTAVLVLGATPGQMGLLGAVDNLPYLMFGLAVGVLVDRLPRRRLMIGADILRAAAVATVPLAAIAGWLTYLQLLVVVFAVGIGNIVFDVSYQAQLPDLVPSEDLVDANGKLETSRSLAFVVGPGLGGTLVQILGAPVAIVGDAISYLVSAASIQAIREPEMARPASDASARKDIAEGIRAVLADRRLVALGLATASMSFALNVWLAVFIYHLTRNVGLDAGAVGIFFVVFGLGGAAGALLAPRIGARVGVGRLLTGAPLVAALGGVAVAAIPGSGPAAVAALGGAAVVLGAGLLAYNVTAAGLRQALAPDALRGRIVATLRFVEWGIMPVGSLVGGALGELAGPRATIAFAAFAISVAAVFVAASPLRRLTAAPV